MQVHQTFSKQKCQLMAALEFVRTYLDDLLCITKGSLDDHLNKLRMVLTKLQEAGLRINAKKRNFAHMKLNTLDMSYQGMAYSIRQTK